MHKTEVAVPFFFFFFSFFSNELLQKFIRACVSCLCVEGQQAAHAVIPPEASAQPAALEAGLAPEASAQPAALEAGSAPEASAQPADCIDHVLTVHPSRQYMAANSKTTTSPPGRRSALPCLSLCQDLQLPYAPLDAPLAHCLSNCLNDHAPYLEWSWT